MRVAGCDPGTSSLDLIVLDNGQVAEQVRFSPQELHADPRAPIAWLQAHGPFALVAGPSGYGLPLKPARECTDADLNLMSLVRPDERGQGQGISGFSALVRALRDSDLPVVFLPGVIHLPTVPPYRKLNRIDMGTPDKVCVAALALAQCGMDEALAIVELGSAFTAILAVHSGEIQMGFGGTSGPMGGASGGAWDGELAYLMGPLRKGDLFRGGLADAPPELVNMAYIDGICQAVWSLPGRIDRVVLSGKMLENRPGFRVSLHDYLDAYPQVELANLPGAWVKHAAQGAALIADGLAGGPFAPIVERMRLREATGTVLDHICHPRAGEIRNMFRV